MIIAQERTVIPSCDVKQDKFLELLGGQIFQKLAHIKWGLL